MPLAYYVSRVCEEFACVPSVALAEVDRLPAGFLEDVIEARSFGVAYDIVQRSEPKDIPDTPMVKLVQEIDLDVALREMKGGGDGDAHN
jgi:hypothetical protein